MTQQQQQQQQQHESISPEALEEMASEADALENDTERIDAYLRVAGLWTDEAGQPAKAIPLYEKILEHDPTHAEASRALEQVYEDSEDWGELAQLLLRRTEQIDDVAEQVELLIRIAGVYELELDDLENAFEVVKLAFQLDYEREDTVGELARLAAELDRWSQTIEEYTTVVHASEDDPVTQVHLANLVARWYAEQLKQPELAITWCQFVLTKDENNLEALDALKELLRQTKRWPELITVLDRYGRLTRDPEEQLSAWIDLAELYEEELAKPDEAVRAFKQALAIDPESIEALEGLERLHRRMQAWEPLVKVLEARCELADDEAERTEIRQSIAELWEEHLGDLDEAVKSYRALIELDPSDIFNLRALERLHTRAESWDALIDVYGMQLDAVESESEKASLHLRSAKVWEGELGNVDQAAEEYEAALGLDPANDDSFAALTRLYPRLSRWNDLTDLLRRRIGVTEAPDERLALYIELGKVLAQRLSDEPQAIEVFRSVLDIEPEHIEAQEQLADLYEATGAEDSALEQLRKLGDEHEDQTRRAEFYFRRGKIHERQQDVDEAISCYEFASRIDEQFLPPLQALGDVYATREEWSNAAGAMEREAARSDDEERKAELFFEAGTIRKNRLRDESGARVLLEKALAISPTSHRVATPLAEIYLANERWTDAEPLLDLLVDPTHREASGASTEDRHAWHLSLAQVARHLDKKKKAEMHYRAAYELAPKDLATLSGLGELLYETKRWPEALRILESLSEEHRDALSSTDVVTTYYRFGVIHRELGDASKSLAMFKKALEVNPQHLETVEALIARYESEEDWEQVVLTKQALVDAIEDVAKQIDVLLEVGDLWQEKLQNNVKASQAYSAVLERDPSRRIALSKLMNIFVDSRQWQRAIDVIQKIVALEANPEVRSKYYATVGKVQRDELKQPDNAINSFNQALDEDPTNLDAFDSMIKSCVEREAWKVAQTNYTRQIKRLEGLKDTEKLASIWRGLGRLLVRLEQHKDAVFAFEAATKLKPKHARGQESLAALYALDPNDWERAGARYAAVLALEPDRVETYRALYDVYARPGQIDGAWCAARALRFLNKSTPDIDTAYEQHAPKTLPVARGTLNPELWHKGVFHRGENRLLRAVFDITGPVLAAMYPVDPKRAGLKRKERLDVKSGKIVLGRYLQYGAQTLGLPLPTVYHQAGTEGIRFVNADPPVLVIGDDVVKGQTERALVFLLGRHLTYLRPEYKLIRALQSQLETQEMLVTQLKALVYATLRCGGPAVEVPAELEPAVKAVLPELQKSLKGQTLQRLRQVLKAAGTLPELDLEAWLGHAELVASRAGLILADDLDSAVVVLRADRNLPTAMAERDRISDLLRYSVSPGYFRVRATLGVRAG